MRFAAPRAILKVAALSAVFSLTLFAAPGAISGKVLEANGDPAPYANLTLTQTATAAHREITAGPDGRYEAPNLAAGSWSVLASSARSRSSISVIADVRAGETLDLSLTLVAVPALVEGKYLPDVPIYNGNYLDALANASRNHARSGRRPASRAFGPYSPRGNFGLNSIGQRSQDNNFQVDGMDNNDSFLRGPILNPPAEAIESALPLLRLYTCR